MARAVELGDAVDDDAPRAGAGNARAHLVETLGNVDDFRLACGVLDHGRAVGQRGRHDRRVGAADGHFGKHDLAALETVRRARHHIAGLDVDLGAEPLHRHDQEVDRPRADGATARHRHPRLAHAGDQRRQHPEARPHLRYQVVGRGGVDDVGRRNVQRLAVICRLARALAADHDVDAVIAEDALQQRHVGEPRHVVEDERLLSEQARDHQRQRGVLCPRNRDSALEAAAAHDANPIHCHPLRPIPGRFHRSFYGPGAAAAQSALPLTVIGLWRNVVKSLLVAPIAAKVGSFRFPPAGFLCRIVARLRGGGAAARLRLAPLEVFPQCRRQTFAPRRPFLRFAGLLHGPNSKHGADGPATDDGVCEAGRACARNLHMARIAAPLRELKFDAGGAAVAQW